jgi:hypothetical protein
MKPAAVTLFTAVMTTVLPCQMACAGGLLNESGQSTLANAFGASSGPETLTVDWSVIENSSDIYTYTYTIENPAGDVLLNNDGSPTSSPEVVDAFSVLFDTTAPGAFVLSSQSGGLTDVNNGAVGLAWSFSAINPGADSPALSFQSSLPPGEGNATALDANPPSPWRSTPGGQQVPVPGAIPEPAPLALLAAALLLLPFQSAIRRFILPGAVAVLPAKRSDQQPVSCLRKS